MMSEPPKHAAVAETEHTPTSRFGGLLRFGFFGLNGLITAAAYTAAFWILRELWPHRITTDVVGAWACSVIANYLGGRLVFRVKTPIIQHLPRYLTVLAGNALMTWTIASLAERAGLPDFAVAYLPVVVTAIPSFLLMQRWVFAA